MRARNLYKSYTIPHTKLIKIKIFRLQIILSTILIKLRSKSFYISRYKNPLNFILMPHAGCGSMRDVINKISCDVLVIALSVSASKTANMS